MEKIYHAHVNQRKARVTILIPKQSELQSQRRFRVTLPRTHNSSKCVWTNNIAEKYVKQKLIEFKEEMDKTTITVIGINAPFQNLIELNRKINTDAELNNTINQEDLTDI